MHRTRTLLLTSLFCSATAASAFPQSDLAGKNFSEATRGSTIGTGLFTIFYKHDDILLSLSPAQLDRDYLLVTQIAQGIGELDWTVVPRFVPTSFDSTAKATALSCGW